MTDAPLPDRDPSDPPATAAGGGIDAAVRAEAATLWRRAEWPTVEPLARLSEMPLDANDLAAWIERRLPDDRRARVEAWLVHDPDALAMVLEAPPAEAEPVPLDLVRRARALAPAGAAADGGWLRAAGWGCVAALVIGAGIAGFKTGVESAETQSALARPALALADTGLGPSAGERGLLGEADF